VEFTEVVKNADWKMVLDRVNWTILIQTLKGNGISWQVKKIDQQTANGFER